MDITSLKPPFNKEESFFIINEFEMEFPLTTVQPILNLSTTQKYETIPKTVAQSTIIRAPDVYEESRQKMLQEMLVKIVEKRSSSKPKSNLELLEQELNRPKAKCVEFSSRRMTERLTRKSLPMLLPPRKRRKKKKTHDQLTRKSATRRTKQREKKIEIKKTQQSRRRINCSQKI